MSSNSKPGLTINFPCAHTHIDLTNSIEAKEKVKKGLAAWAATKDIQIAGD
jgi:hypothetical protein